MPVRERAVDDRVLAEEAGEAAERRRSTSVPISIAQNANGIRRRKPPIRRTSCSSCKRVDDDAGAEEQLRLEERVREEVQHAGVVRADADAHDHVADLATSSSRRESA